MKKIPQQLLLLASMLLLFTNCEKEFFVNSNCTNIDGQVMTEIIELPTIHSFDIGIPVDLILFEGDEQGIVIESNQDMIDEIIAKSKTRDGVWKIDLNRCRIPETSFLGDYVARILVTMATLREVKISGPVRLATGQVFSNISDLKLDVSGVAEINLRMDTLTSLETKISGLGDIKLRGVVGNHLLEIQGSSKMEAFGLITQNCQIKIEGSGNCEVTALETLDVEISGSGEICYKGNPTLSLDNQGGGEVKNCN